MTQRRLSEPITGKQIRTGLLKSRQIPYNRAMIRLFVNNLTIIDFSYLHPQRGLLGESWKVRIELTGETDFQGMVLDFGDIKKQVKQLIDERFDHKLIVPTGFSGTKLERHSTFWQIRFTTNSNARIETQAPENAFCLLDEESVTRDNLAKAIETAIYPLLPKNVSSVSILLTPESIDGAYYHYSHGLKHHCGNCQRIAHGHRSRLEIHKDGQRCASLESYWAEKWQDIYLGSRADLKQRLEIDNRPYLEFRYSGSQGDYEITLPEQHCYLLDTDTTVENIARHLASESARRHPESRITVHAFEGFDKGAIASTGH